MRTITDSEIEKLALQNGYSNDFHIDVFRDGFKACRSQIEDQEQWVDVNERLPEQEDSDENGNVLIYRETNSGQKALSKSIYPWHMVRYCDNKTFWRPLPQPPTERKEEK